MGRAPNNLLRQPWLCNKAQQKRARTRHHPPLRHREACPTDPATRERRCEGRRRSQQQPAALGVRQGLSNRRDFTMLRSPRGTLVAGVVILLAAAVGLSGALASPSRLAASTITKAPFGSTSEGPVDLYTLT